VRRPSCPFKAFFPLAGDPLLIVVAAMQAKLVDRHPAGKVAESLSLEPIAAPIYDLKIIPHRNRKILRILDLNYSKFQSTIAPEVLSMDWTNQGKRDGKPHYQWQNNQC
jgi:hypothetical protein